MVAGSSPQSNRTPLFTLLHTNDFHNHLTQAHALRLGQMRQQLGESGMIVDAGDAIAAGNLTFRPGGEPILDTLTRIGYAAMTVGNREFHLTQIGFHSKLSRARFPVLCANVHPAHAAPYSQLALENLENQGIMSTGLPVCPFLVLEVAGGWKIALLGLTVPMITAQMLSRKVSAFVFDDPLAVAARLVPWLHTQHAPDVTIALTHIGLPRDRALAETVPGIDLIVGGHTHDVLEKGERVGQTLIVQAGSHGRYVGIVEILRESGGDAPLEMRARLETL